MFSKIALFSVSVLVAIATANPLESRKTSQCNTGSLQCCKSLQSANSPQAAAALGPLGLLGLITGQVGLTCSPLPVVGLAQNSCTQQPVCCTGNNYNGLVVVGCSPISA